MKLLKQIEKEAEVYNVIVNPLQDGVELIAPEGYCFEEGLHALVSAQWDHEPMPNVYRAGLKDLRENGPRLKPCALDCECRDE